MRDRTKQKGDSGRDGSKKHTSEKGGRGGEGLVKTLPFPCHRVFVGGRDPGGGMVDGAVGKAVFRFWMFLVVFSCFILIPTKQGLLSPAGRVYCS